MWRNNGVNKNRTIRIIIGVTMALLYMLIYGVYRINGDFVHKKTWSSGWNSHWIADKHAAPAVRPLDYEPPRTEVYKRETPALKEFGHGFQVDSTRMSLLGFIFLPARCAEAVIWWIFNPQGR